MQKISEFIDIILKVITICAVIVAVFLAGMLMMNIKSYRVMSSSMEPEIRKGEIAFVDTSVKDYKEGEIITFNPGGDSEFCVTHRIIAEDEGKYITKGDANLFSDSSPVDRENIEGKCIFSLPGPSCAAGKVGEVVLKVKRIFRSRKFLAVVLIVIVILVLGFDNKGTLAYKKTESVGNNEFKIGDVAIDILTPELPDSPGFKDDFDNVFPGREIRKNPQVKNTGNNPLLAFVKIEIPRKKMEVADENGEVMPKKYRDAVVLLHNDNIGFNYEDWYIVSDIISKRSHQIVFVYKKTLEKEEQTSSPFEKLKMVNYLPGEIKEKDGLFVNASAYAVQADWLQFGKDGNIDGISENSRGICPKQITSEIGVQAWQILSGED